MNMKIYFFYLFVIWLCLFENSAGYKSSECELTNKTRISRFLYLHDIEEDLLHQSWEYQEKPCLNQLLKIIGNVQNSTLWATWIWDSMQFPVGQLYGTRIHLGNYDQCMDTPGEEHEVRTQYCLAELKLAELDSGVAEVDSFGSVEDFIRHKTKHGLSYNTLFWGICAPTACEPKSISKLVDAMFRVTHLGRLDTKINITVDSAYCQTIHEVDGLDFRDYVAISLIVIAIVMTILCTVAVNFKGAITNSTVMDLAKAFDIHTNAALLIKVEDQSIRSVMGVRMISTFIILLAHQWLSKNIFGVSNAGQIDKILDDPLQCVRFNADLIVDVFFMLSGLLLTKNLVGKSPKSFNLCTVIFKRYIRLMSPVVLIILFLPIVLPRGESGPLVNKYLQLDIDSCAQSWWKTVLMIGNYGDTEKMCYVVLWSLASDFHLFLIGVLMYWIYRRNRRAAITANIVLATASILMPVIYGYIHHSPAVTSFDFRTSDNVRKHLISDPAYVRTHLRAGPYFVGIALGYLMTVYRPETHRNVMSKKQSISLFVVFLSVLACVLAVSGIYHGRQYGPLEGAAFSVLRRNAIAALGGLLIVVCEYGSLPYISSALSWSGLVLPSKLSYGVYLTHYMLIMRILSSARGPLRSDAIDDIYSTFGLLTVSSALSFVMWIFWEAPIANMVDVILRRSNSNKQENGSINIRNNVETTRHRPDDFMNGKKKKEI